MVRVMLLFPSSAALALLLAAAPAPAAPFDLQAYCARQAARRAPDDGLQQMQESHTCYGQIASYARQKGLSEQQAAADIRRGLIQCARELGGMTEAAAKQHYNRLGWYGICD